MTFNNNSFGLLLISWPDFETLVRSLSDSFFEHPIKFTHLTTALITCSCTRSAGHPLYSCWALGTRQQRIAPMTNPPTFSEVSNPQGAHKTNPFLCAVHGLSPTIPPKCCFFCVFLRVFIIPLPTFKNILCKHACLHKFYTFSLIFK